jgi:hypothetical protein
VTDVRAAVEQMRGRGVEFEEYDTPETRTENGIARMPGGGEAAWFKDSEGNLVGSSCAETYDPHGPVAGPAGSGVGGAGVRFAVEDPAGQAGHLGLGAQVRKSPVAGSTRWAVSPACVRPRP